MKDVIGIQAGTLLVVLLVVLGIVLGLLGIAALRDRFAKHASPLESAIGEAAACLPDEVMRELRQTYACGSSEAKGMPVTFRATEEEAVDTTGLAPGELERLVSLVSSPLEGELYKIPFADLADAAVYR